MKKRIVSILLTMCMVLCLMPTAAFAEAAPTGTALTQENISNYKQEKDSTYSENGVYLPTGSYYLAEDIYLVGDDADPNSVWPLIISREAVTLDLNGHVLDLKKKDINIHSAGNLTLTDSNRNAEHKFRVEDSGLWVWDETQGTETVTGGVITGGTGVNGGNGTMGTLGGGVNVSGGGLTMEGGSIVGCTANNGGGVRVSNGSFTMNGGRIAGCTAVKEGNSYGSGGGVRVGESGSFTMKGGRIAGCTAADAGGGVNVAYGSFTMAGGSIADCTASETGGGVDACGNRFTMDGGSITNCTANYGGGVNLSNNDFTMNGSSIKSCTANNGGGIYVQPSSLAKLTMFNGSITNCTATYAGGGVFVCSDYESGSFTMNGGSITNCKAGSEPNAVHTDGLFTSTGGSADPVTGSSLSNYGEAANPILIATPKGLEDFRDRVNNGETSLCAKLTADIVLNDGTFDENGNYTKGESGKDAETWEPIRNYCGTFDGNGKTIKGLYVNGGTYAGLFGYSSPRGAAVKNVAVTGYVSGKRAGGIAGEMFDGSISNCLNHCTVTGSNYVGGIVGYADTAINNCGNSGSVSGSYDVGGIAGSYGYNTIANCYNVGQVSTADETGYIGGIVGWQAGGTVNNCYYPTGAADKGIGYAYDSPTVTNTEAKSKAEFADGTVLNLLKNGDENSPWEKCGYLAAAGMTLPLLSWQTADAHTCTPENPSQWESDESGHWQVCSCGLSVNKAAHFGTDDGDCTTAVECVCGYVTKAAETAHNWSTWTQNSGNDTHSHRCRNVGCTASETENCTGGTAACKDKAICEICGESYGELDPDNHSDLKYFAAKPATETEEGNIEYWYCSDCKKYFSDSSCEREISQADMITAKLEKKNTENNDAVKADKSTKSPDTGNNCHLVAWCALLFTGSALCITVLRKKKKYNR